MNFSKLTASMASALADEKDTYQVSIRLKTAVDDKAAEALTGLGVNVVRGRAILTGTVKREDIDLLSDMDIVFNISAAAKLESLHCAEEPEQPAVNLETVRKLLSNVPNSLAKDISKEREQHGR